MASRLEMPAPMTVAEFLKWDDGTDMRHELVDGEIVATNPPLAPHARLVAVIGGALERRLPRAAEFTPVAAPSLPAMTSTTEPRT